MPNTTYAQFADVRDDYFTMGLHHRRLYASMVNYMDTAIGDIVQVVKDKHTTGAAASMWAHTLVVFQTGKRHTSGFVLCHASCPKEHVCGCTTTTSLQFSVAGFTPRYRYLVLATDNGGPSFAGGLPTANNYPHKGVRSSLAALVNPLVLFRSCMSFCSARSCSVMAH